MRINFLVCGTQKGGTSALTAYLRQHPGIQMATRKEVHFFDNDHNFATSEPDYAVTMKLEHRTHARPSKLSLRGKQ